MGAARNAMNRRTAGARNPYGASERRPRRRAGWRTPGAVREGLVVDIGPLPGAAVVGAGRQVAGTRGARVPQRCSLGDGEPGLLQVRDGGALHGGQGLTELRRRARVGRLAERVVV